MGFIIHFYIIFGTNLLTQGPVQIAVFCLFQCFAEKEYQTESKRNETSVSGIYPAVCPGQKYDPAGLGVFIGNPPEWRLTSLTTHRWP